MRRRGFRAVSLPEVFLLDCVPENRKRGQCEYLSLILARFVLSISTVQVYISKSEMMAYVSSI